MKFLSFLVPVFFVIAAAAQSPLTIDSVIHVNNTTNSELFNKGEGWIVSAFRNANHVIQLKDKESGQITAKGVFKYVAPNWWGWRNSKCEWLCTFYN